MNELLQEFVDSRGVALRIDRNEGVLRGVKLLGLESRNGRRYLPEALAAAAGLYEGARVNVNHPKGGPLSARDYQDRIGVVRNVAARSNEGLFGDLHFNPKHALAEQLLWDAEHAPENVGFSHNVQARTSRQGEQTIVEVILHVQSVDLVADPATTRGLFESESPARDVTSGPSLRSDPGTRERATLLETLTVDLLRLSRPDLVTQLTESLVEENRALKAEIERQRAATKPVSREQEAAEPVLERFDTTGFVRAIT